MPSALRASTSGPATPAPPSLDMQARGLTAVVRASPHYWLQQRGRGRAPGGRGGAPRGPGLTALAHLGFAPAAAAAATICSKSRAARHQFRKRRPCPRADRGTVRRQSPSTSSGCGSKAVAEQVGCDSLPSPSNAHLAPGRSPDAGVQPGWQCPCEPGSPSCSDLRPPPQGPGWSASRSSWSGSRPPTRSPVRHQGRGRGCAQRGPWPRRRGAPHA